ncbi:MAG: hypothetical protein R2695_04175 [Acidimicrobiales bacterium]
MAPTARLAGGRSDRQRHRVPTDPDRRFDRRRHPRTWVISTWEVAYGATRRTAWASTPIIGAGGITVAVGKQYRLLARMNFGAGHIPIVAVAGLVVAGSTDRVGR